MTAPRLTGGESSIDADLIGIAMLARALAVAAAMARRCAARSVFEGLPIHAAAAAVLDPLGASRLAALEVAAAAACLLAAASCAALSAGLRTAARAYRQADQLRATFAPVVRAVEGIPSLLLAGGDAAMEGRPRAVLDALSRDPDLAGVLCELVAVTLPLASARGGPISLLGPPPVVRTSAALARLYRDGPAVVAERPAGLANRDRPPRSSADLLRSVAARSAVNYDGGEIDIRLLSRADRSRSRPVAARSVVVDLPGTTNWAPWPGDRHPAVADLSSNLRSIANLPSTYARGVVQALRACGVRPDDPIMLVGHSEGGLIAAGLASTLARTGEFRVTHVLTAGSPTGNAPIPASVQVLSLENRGDLVPALDARDNPARPTWLTAHVDRGGSTIADQHSLDSYISAAEGLNVDPDPRLSRWRSGASVFLTAHEVQTRVFRLTRP